MMQKAGMETEAAASVSVPALYGRNSFGSYTGMLSIYNISLHKSI